MMRKIFILLVTAIFSFHSPQVFSQKWDYGDQFKFHSAYLSTGILLGVAVSKEMVEYGRRLDTVGTEYASGYDMLHSGVNLLLHYAFNKFELGFNAAYVNSSVEFKDDFIDYNRFSYGLLANYKYRFGFTAKHYLFAGIGINSNHSSFAIYNDQYFSLGIRAGYVKDYRHFSFSPYLIADIKQNRKVGRWTSMDGKKKVMRINPSSISIGFCMTVRLFKKAPKPKKNQ